MNKNTIFKVNPKKEDSFALGLILIEAGTGLSCQELYKNRKRFNKERFKHMITAFEFSHNSDPELVKRIKALCEIDTNLRKEVNAFIFEKVSKPVEPNTNQNSVYNPNSDSNFFDNSNAGILPLSRGSSSVNSWANTKRPLSLFYSPNNSNQQVIRETEKKSKRNYTPTRTNNALGYLYNNDNNHNYNFTLKNNRTTPLKVYKKKPELKKYMEPIYENKYSNQTLNSKKDNFFFKNSKSVPKKTYTYDLTGNNLSLIHI